MTVDMLVTLYELRSGNAVVGGDTAVVDGSPAVNGYFPLSHVYHHFRCLSRLTAVSFLGRGQHFLP